MEIIKTEVLVKQTVEQYKADDGTVFKDKDECLKYEQSARKSIIELFEKTFKFDLKKKLTKIGDNIMFGCYPDNDFYAIIITTIEELKVFNMWAKEIDLGETFTADAIHKVHILEHENNDCNYDGIWHYDGTLARVCKDFDKLADECIKTARARLTEQ